MIEVRDLHKRHGSSEVLRGVSLAVRAGEVAVIIGPSGGGKSTFLRCLNGLERFERGSVRIGAHQLTAATDPRRDAATLQAVRGRLGFVFQQFNLFPHMTAIGNIIEAPIRVRGLGRHEAVALGRKLLERVGMGDRGDALPRQLSGGQQQRVAIARALAMEPAAVLFDEPTSSLDAAMSAEILAIISDLAARDLTMVVVTHQIGFARQLADTVHVFAAGQVVESGPPAQVLADPRHPVTRSLLGPAG